MLGSPHPKTETTRLARGVVSGGGEESLRVRGAGCGGSYGLGCFTGDILIMVRVLGRGGGGRRRRRRVRGMDDQRAAD
jgi:hypothetical protein